MTLTRRFMTSAIAALALALALSAAAQTPPRVGAYAR